MMRGELLCWDGRRIRLPDAVEWRFQYGCGTPCDSFQLTCLWEPDNGNDLAEAVSFTAEENGERLFTGVVDECERGWDTAGGTLTVAGRGMAARLLDNEALGADYQVATVEDILRDHVAPYGIETVRGAELPSLRQEPRADYVGYSFAFWEGYDGHSTGVQVTGGGGEPETGPAAGTAGERRHTVRRGETLWGIARDYGLSLTELIALNPQIKNPNLILAGEEVRLA